MGGGVKKTLALNSLMGAARLEAGGGWSSEEICNPSVGTVSAGGLGGCHRFRGVSVRVLRGGGFSVSRLRFVGGCLGRMGSLFLWVPVLF